MCCTLAAAYPKPLSEALRILAVDAVGSTAVRQASDGSPLAVDCGDVSLPPTFGREVLAHTASGVSSRGCWSACGRWHRCHRRAGHGKDGRTGAAWGDSRPSGVRNTHVVEQWFCGAMMDRVVEGEAVHTRRATSRRGDTRPLCRQPGGAINVALPTGGHRHSQALRPRVCGTAGAGGICMCYTARTCARGGHLCPVLGRSRRVVAVRER